MKTHVKILAGAVCSFALLAVFFFNADSAVASYVSSASYDSVDFLIGAQDTTPTGATFNADGTKMFMVGGINASVNEYTLTTGFDVSTASFVDSFSVAGQDTFPAGVTFNTDGTKMFVVGAVNDAVNEYTLSTAFDISTAAFVHSTSTAVQETDPGDVAFNTDGTKMFVLGDSGDNVNEYTLSSGFDVSTALFVHSTSTAAEESKPTGLAFNADGTKMFVAGTSGDDVNEYTLSTGFDVSTALFVDSFSVAGQETVLSDVAFNTDGSKMYVVGTIGDDINEYDLSTGFDVSTGSFVDSFSFLGKDTSPTGAVFNTDGTKMFVTGNVNDAVYEYTLSTAFDISTAAFVHSTSTAAEETSPNALAFNTDGTKMFVAGSIGDDVNEYTLSTGFDVSTALFVDSFSVVIDFTGNPQGLAFNTDGTKMFTTSASDILVHEFNLTTGFDVSTASFTDSFDISGEVISPRGVAFNAAGTKMFFVDSTNDDVFEYDLGTSFDVSTATFVDSFDISGEDTTPHDITFNNTGSKMYVVGQSSDKVYQYSLDATAPTVSTFSPADGATGVSRSANLVLTFSEAVDAESGNVTIKRTNDDSTFEQIDVTGALVTGSGTTAITINPTDDFEEGEGYYVNIDAIAFDDAAGNSYAGISNKTTWNFGVSESTGGGGGGGGYKGVPKDDDDSDDDDDDDTDDGDDTGDTANPVLSRLREILQTRQAQGLPLPPGALSLLANLPASPSAPASPLFTRDLFLGIVGEDVRVLQEFLNRSRFPLADNGPGSPGQETTYFGPLTQAALIRFQQANNITPSVGYFGPVTRGVVGEG